MLPPHPTSAPAGEVASREHELAAKSDASPREYFPCLDGYRALAALSVLVCHVALISGLNVRTSTSWGPYLARLDIGVSIFFVLSGFLLYRPFVAARLSARRVLPVGEFYRRRLLRIVPAYWLALTVVAFVLHAPGFDSSHSVPLHYLLLHVYVLPMVTGGPVQQSWSLATEISFYAVLPLYVWLLGRRQRTPAAQLRVECWGVGTLIFASVYLKLICLGAGVHANRFGQWGVWLPFRLDEFGLGMALAVGSAWLAHRDRRPAWLEHPALPWACWIGAAVGFWAICTRLSLPLGPTFTSRQAFVVQDLYVLVAVLLLVPGFFGSRAAHIGPIRALLQHPVMVWLGLISYGIYIWHEAWIERWFRYTGDRVFQAPFWPMLGADVVLTVVVSALSYYLLERPVQRFGRRMRAR